jgi:CTP synthase
VEANPNTKSPIISWMPGQSEDLEKWWSMRLWSYTTKLKKWSKVANLYKEQKVTERHRHRFEVNPDYYELLEEHGMTLCGRDTKTKLVEFIELPHHPFFVWTQAHPEFKSRLDRPHPLFIGFIEACLHR